MVWAESLAVSPERAAQAERERATVQLVATVRSLLDAPSGRGFDDARAALAEYDQVVRP